MLTAVGRAKPDDAIERTIALFGAPCGGFSCPVTLGYLSHSCFGDGQLRNS